MSLLSRNDSLELVQELEKLGEKEDRVDDSLIQGTSAVVEAWQPRIGFSDVILRHVTTICGHLRNGLGELSRFRARGALVLISRELGRDGGSRPLEGQVLAFVAGFIVHEIRERKHAKVLYRPFDLSREDRQAAEDLLMAFYELPIYSDEELLLLVDGFEDEHSRLKGSNFFGRLLLNLSVLKQVLQSDEATPEDRSWARAGLSYIVEAEDAIDDRLGLLGLLDDAFVAALVASIVQPYSPPWPDLLDRLYRAWPFVDEIVLHGKNAGRPMTEFLAVNSALVCREIRAEPDKPLALVLPQTGSMPLLLAAISAIGLLQEWLEGCASPLQFKKGQTVRLDNCATAHFMGIRALQEGVEGAERIALRFWNKKGNEETVYLPISERPRLTPAEHEERPRGPIDQTQKNIVHLSALEHVFHLSRPRAIFDIPGKVVLVAPLGLTRSLASEIHLCGVALHSAFPMGHRRACGSYESWDKRFAALPPVLEIVPSLQQALRQIVEQSEPISLVILDIRGVNAGKPAEIDEIRRSGAPLLLITEEHEEAALAFLEQKPVSHWVWTPEDIASLVWPARKAHPSAVGRYEEGIRLCAVAETRVVDLEDPRVEGVFDQLYSLRRYFRRQVEEGEELPADLLRVIELAEALAFPLLRMHSRVDRYEHQRLTLREMVENADLSDGEIGELKLFVDSVEVACQGPRADLRKVTVMKLMSELDGAKLLVRDEWEKNAFLESTEISPERVMSRHTASAERMPEHLVVAGWFGRKRMARLLVPPASPSIHLVLNAVERRWFQGFQDKRGSFQRKYRRLQDRELIFPDLEWRGRPKIDSGNRREEMSSRGDDLDDLQDARRQGLALGRWSHLEGSRCEAHLALFEGRFLAFLTEAFKIPVIFVGRGNGVACEQIVAVEELRRGDAVFLPTERLERLVHETAAGTLSVDVIQHSRLWRGALERFLRAHSEAGLKELQRRLEAEGCKRHLTTIRSWIRSESTIAPQNAEEDLAAIARATGDRALREGLGQCLSATRVVYQARKVAKNRLQDEAIGALRASVEEERESWGGFEYREAFRVVWVADIESKIRRVPRAITNQLLWEE